jgi:hypothetical protein
MLSMPSADSSRTICWFAWFSPFDDTPSRCTSPRMTSMRSGLSTLRRSLTRSPSSFNFSVIIGCPAGYVPVSRRRLAKPLRTGSGSSAGGVVAGVFATIVAVVIVLEAPAP